MGELVALRLNRMANQIAGKRWRYKVLELDKPESWKKLQVGKHYDMCIKANGVLGWVPEARLSAVDVEKQSLTLSRP